MPLPLLAIALQLQVAGLAATPAPPQLVVRADSQRIVEQARGAQDSFEWRRRSQLPWSQGSGGRCDARIGRFCWWYDDAITSVPKEPPAIGRARRALLDQLDALGDQLPGDSWLAGLRVRYAVEDRDFASADDVAQKCTASAWSCAVLRAYAAQARGDNVGADSTYANALALMPEAQRCAWRDIRVLLAIDVRDRYEAATCAGRAAIESRYWTLSTPRFAAHANEWRVEFYGRRFVSSILKNARTPYRMSWGDDVDEMNLRYGWPIAWSRVQPQYIANDEPTIVGHDAVPSFPFAPREELLVDSLTGAGDDAWQLVDRAAAARVSLSRLRHVVPAHAQIARFERGDSTLVVAAFGATDDSLRDAHATLGAALGDGRLFAADGDTLPAHESRLRLVVPGTPLIAGVELADSVTGTLARSRMLYPVRTDSARRPLSDLLVFRFQGEPTPSLDSALAGAVAGESVLRDTPIGVYWETYGVSDQGDQVGTEVTVERIGQGFFHRARQRMGLADADSPLHIRWSDARVGISGVAARAISLDLNTLASGRYRITLSLAPTGAPVTSSSREIELTAP